MESRAKKIVANDEKLKRIKDAIMEIYSPEKIMFFGSRTSRKDRKDSDYDIFVILEDTEIPFYGRSVPVRKKLRHLGAPLDLLILQKSEIDIENPFFKEILSEGIVIYERKTH